MSSRPPGPVPHQAAADEPTTSPVLTPLPIRSAGERIADRIVTAVALGQFVPGQRLPSERDLATMLEVSRGTVREALQRLAASGHLTIKRGRGGGAFIGEGWTPESDEMVRRTLLPEWERLEHLLDMRQLVEQQIARTAAERRKREDVRHIKAALKAYANAGEDRDSSRAADAAVHGAVAAATHNPLLVQLSGQLRHDISLGFEAEPYSAAIRARALEQHPRLAAAVVDGDPDGAAAEAAHHFELTEQTLRALQAKFTTASRQQPRRKRTPTGPA